MDKLIFTSLSGQKYIDQRVQQISNEIANVSTTGFKREFAAATQTYRYDGDGFKSRYVSVVSPTARVDLADGPMQSTGRPLDIAVGGNQLLAVLTDKGDVAYTRRGDVSVGADGLLRVGSGERLASDSGTPISIPALTEIKIGPDGTVLGRQGAGEAVIFQPIARVQVVGAEPEKVVLRPDGLYGSSDGQPFQAAETPVVQSGVLEGSNVSLFSAMVDMISMSRRYEMQVKVLKQTSDLAERSQSLARLSQ
ncbi:MAG: flagellar hook-basal body complex protein [Actinobacteria bacterium]|nr:flagellar hook-basal body complex protein [Actinomycetota bacterium]NBR68212.1 flagellar hook-basal body complex protein [Actinomycetota bacterium]